MVITVTDTHGNEGSRTLTLTVHPALVPPAATLAFSHTTIVADGIQTTILTVSLTNPNPGADLTGVGTEPFLLPEGFDASAISGTCRGTALCDKPTRLMTMSGFPLSAGASCTLALTFSTTNAGSHSVVIDAVTSSQTGPD